MGKISMNDFADLLVEKHKVSKATAQLFLTSIVSSIQDGISDDKLVKIKGLGTFKIVEVDARESIDVNTGERVIIESHQKLSFIPDAQMKALVNKPFEDFETVILDEGNGETEDNNSHGETRIDTEVDTDNGHGETRIDTEVDTDNGHGETQIDTDNNTDGDTETETKESETTEEINEPAVEETKSEEEVVLVEEDKPEEEVVIVEEDKQEEESTTVEDDKQEEEETEVKPVVAPTLAESKPRGNGLRMLMPAVLIALVCGFAGGYYFGRKSMQTDKAPQATVMEQPSETSETPANGEASQTPANGEASQSPASTVTPEASAASEPSNTDDTTEPIWEKYNNMDVRTRDGAYYIMGLDRTYTIREGDNLRKIARVVFGGADMSCYIEVYNNINSSTKLVPGQVIKIPKIEMKKKVRRRLQEESNN